MFYSFNGQPFTNINKLLFIEEQHILLGYSTFNVVEHLRDNVVPAITLNIIETINRCSLLVMIQRN